MMELKKEKHGAWRAIGVLEPNVYVLYFMSENKKLNSWVTFNKESFEEFVTEFRAVIEEDQKEHAPKEIQ